MSSALFIAKNISKQYLKPTAVQVLDDINLEIANESSIAIMGASGEGKTTLLHILSLLEAPDSGTLIFQDKTIEKPDFQKLQLNHFGFIFQSYNLFNDLTVIDNLLIVAKIARKAVHKKSDAYHKAVDLLEKVDLQDKLLTPVKLLSGGEKQRVAIARAFFNDPSIIFADEPTGNLDHETSDKIHTLLFSFIKQYKKALVIATHDKRLATLCDQIYLLDQASLSLQ